MGNYESVKFGATVELTDDDFSAPEGAVVSIDIMNSEAESRLRVALREDIANASQLTGVGTSFIHTIDEDLNA
jgi:hypothetical protein